MPVDGSHAHASEALTCEIVAALESAGLSREAYRLGETFDPVALSGFLGSCSGPVTVRLEVEGRPLVVTDEGVLVLDGDELGVGKE